MGLSIVDNTGLYTAPMARAIITGGGPTPVQQHYIVLLDSTGLYTIPVMPVAITGGGSVTVEHNLVILDQTGLYTAPVIPAVIAGGGTVLVSTRQFTIIDDTGLYTFPEYIEPILVIPEPWLQEYAPLPEYTMYIDSNLSNLALDYEPTSVYVKGSQIYNWHFESGMLYLDNTVYIGSYLTALPPFAVRFLDDDIQTVNITEVGIHSVFSDPFGKILFSLDQITWAKSLTSVFPALVYCKLVPTTPLYDYVCKVDYEIVVWRGNDATFINEEGLVEVHEPGLPGGLEYHVY